MLVSKDILTLRWRHRWHYFKAINICLCTVHVLLTANFSDPAAFCPPSSAREDQASGSSSMDYTGKPAVGQPVHVVRRSRSPESLLHPASD